MAVDDDPEVLGAVDRDLRQRYRQDYRIVRAGSGAEALETARRLKQRGTPVALLLVDERMPGMSGTEMLREAKVLFPDSRRVLLTAYADTEAAIRGINDVGLDHYLMKPWDPPALRLYPVLDDLLESWLATNQLPYDGIRVAGASWSAHSFAVKDFLSRNGVPYQWVDVTEDPSMAAAVAEFAGDPPRLPVVLLGDGEALVQPTNVQLAARIGLQTAARLPFYDLVIVGGGPAGLASAVYAASEGLRTVLIEQDAPGGQAGTSSQIENYLGFPSGVTGAELARRATAQAKRFGTEVICAPVIGVRRQDPYRIIRLADGTEIAGYAVVLAQGVAVRTLPVPGLPGLVGRGVFYGAAMTEAAAIRDQDVCVVGGANSAGQGALFFSRYARHVTMLVRAESLERAMSRYLVDRIEATPNIDVLTGVEVAAVAGEKRLDSVVVRSLDTGDEHEEKPAALFVFVGSAPHTDAVAGLVDLDDRGYVLTGPDLSRGATGRPTGWRLERDPYLFETNVPGIFAVGDVRAGSGKRVAAAVGEGSGTVSMVHRYLQTV